MHIEMDLQIKSMSKQLESMNSLTQQNKELQTQLQDQIEKGNLNEEKEKTRSSEIQVNFH